jgi:hypothetical protein
LKIGFWGSYTSSDNCIQTTCTLLGKSYSKGANRYYRNDAGVCYSSTCLVPNWSDSSVSDGCAPIVKNTTFCMGANAVANIPTGTIRRFRDSNQDCKAVTCIEGGVWSDPVSADGCSAIVENVCKTNLQDYKIGDTRTST